VAMMVILQPDDLPAGSDKEKHVLLTVQPRIAAGSLGFCELPAGMVDAGSFKGAAANEIQEELGLKIPEVGSTYPALGYKSIGILGKYYTNVWFRMN
jgi:ADP-sugar diphosphatase